MNHLRALSDYRQAIWLDFLARSFVANGELQKLVTDDGIKGVTSNPAIFEKAIAGSNEYDIPVKRLLDKSDRSVSFLYESLAIEDIQQAADVLRPIYDSSHGEDGFVSLEISPYLATDATESVAEGRRLWATVDRDNLMIKVPATAAGLSAIHDLVADGINVNVTLLFSQIAYEAVVEAYLSGLEKRESKGGDLSRISSVASFFVSRIDTIVDKLLDEKIAKSRNTHEKERLLNLKGKVAIANAKLAYQRYTRLFSGPRWKALATKGARPQRLLWASTGTKNKAFSDVLYVEELIGPNTVNTVPPATLDAFRDHGKADNTLQADIDQAEVVLRTLADCEISLDAATDQLLLEGVKLFSDAADSLLGAVASKRTEFLHNTLNEQHLSLGNGLYQSVAEDLEKWRQNGNIRRLWRRDSSLWTGSDEHNWLGWLDSTANELRKVEQYRSFSRTIHDEIDNVVLLGMGGSSLGPEVIAQILGGVSNAPKLHILDSTDPAQIKSVEGAVGVAKTLFIVSSKSGTTIESSVLAAYFLERISKFLGSDKAGSRFVAITDPGSPLDKLAAENNFRHVFHGEPSIGGRFSVLSPFGLVPAAAVGIDPGRLLNSSRTMIRSCSADVPPSQNPGVQLGLAMAAASRVGRDKITVSLSPEIASFGAWVEQLIAESTGKNGKALIPIAGEPLGKPEVYGPDRFFIDLRCENGSDPNRAQLSDLEKSGHPVVRIVLKSLGELGQEFFRFEMATSVAAAALGINPFDQPDVEASKAKAREMIAAFEKTGALPSLCVVTSNQIMDVYADPSYAETLQLTRTGTDVNSCLKHHLRTIGSGDYFAILAFIERTQTNSDGLQRVRLSLRDKYRVATSLGFGPRFLHSTGQAYKGGPDTGVFLQVTANDECDFAAPGHSATFGVLKTSQARADFDVLASRGRRVLGVHLKGEIASGIVALSETIKRAIS